MTASFDPNSAIETLDEPDYADIEHRQAAEVNRRDAMSKELERQKAERERLRFQAETQRQEQRNQIYQERIQHRNAVYARWNEIEAHDNAMLHIKNAKNYPNLKPLLIEEEIRRHGISMIVEWPIMNENGVLLEGNIKHPDPFPQYIPDENEGGFDMFCMHSFHNEFIRAHGTPQLDHSVMEQEVSKVKCNASQ
jgi:hypothetical protein